MMNKLLSNIVFLCMAVVAGRSVSAQDKVHYLKQIKPILAATA